MIKANTLFMLSQGAYSDYQDLALCRALCDLDPEALADEYFELYPEQRKELKFKHDQFVEWLISNKAHMMEEVEYCGWHLADYYTYESDLSQPPTRH